MSAPEFDEMRADMLERGYADLPELNGIAVGTRVRHAGEMYPRAFREGTATVRAIMEKDPSSWAQTYRHRDVELIVERDEPWPFGIQFGQWADYHTCRVEPSP